MTESPTFPLPFEYLKLGGRIPYDVWNEHGLLLLARDQPIETEQQLDLLLEQRCLVTLEEAAWPEEVRHRAPLPAERDAVSLWPALHTSLQQVMLSHEGRTDIAVNLEQIRNAAVDLLDNQRDHSLFLLVRSVVTGESSYAAANALAAAAVCHMLSPDAGLDAAASRSLFLAALSMNMGMWTLQDTLARRDGPPSRMERQLIRNHPDTSEALLQSSGVDDPLWLSTVRFHHAPPAEHGCARLLHLADLYVARISPRRQRRGLSPQAAMRRLYQDLQKDWPVMAAALVRRLGIYPPGSFVRLADGEYAIVVGVGFQANQPLVVAVATPSRTVLAKPVLRDTRLPEHEVRELVRHDEISVNLDLPRILRFC
ncbi:MAG: hypothetical protein RL026_2707 [Pseudomonadota bacterium]|jgi:HD-GYP domain-containing protein (c-di-GMP phosphodiesterase class II)